MSAHPVLSCFPYLHVNDVFEFADWRLGPLEAFETSWADQAFKTQATAFLAKFVGHNGKPIERPTLLCRRTGLVDGVPPSVEERQALELAIGFAFLDRNPRRLPNAALQGWMVVTADNLESHYWPIDLAHGEVTLTTGSILRTLNGGYRIRDPGFEIRPPLELHMGFNHSRPDVERLEALYTVLLAALTGPGANPAADRLAITVGWLLKAWRNTPSITNADRIVYLKTGFEALLKTSSSRQAATALRTLFEALPGTQASDAAALVWSPTEQPVHPHVYKLRTEQLTDLEHWFMAFAEARNSIIHDGVVPAFHYQAGANYDGHLMWTAEYVLRAAVRVTLAGLGYPDIWRSEMWRAAKAALDAASATTSPETP